MIGPALVLSVIVGLFHVSAYVFIRGRAGARLPLLIVAAILGAWAGDTVGARLGIDPLRVGEFNLLAASLVAWLAIGLVAIVAVLVPERTPSETREIVSIVARRATKGPTDPAPAAAPETGTPP
jgi:uncharacterized membrane protein YdjX (TVP38/TMEM64 family)